MQPGQPQRLSRRMLLGVAAPASAIGVAGAMTRNGVDLYYAGAWLSWPGGATRAACGRGGVRRDKQEGDGASPEGRFPLVRAFYRPDRIAPPPATGLPLAPLNPADGWCDDPADPRYNRLVRLPCSAHHEDMWRADGLYDLVVVIGYNTAPVVPGRGSAIFLHCASPDFAPTIGCIAIEREVLLALLPLLGPHSRITIRP